MICRAFLISLSPNDRLARCCHRSVARASLRAGDGLPRPCYMAAVGFRTNAAGKGPVSGGALGACIANLKNVYFTHLNVKGARQVVAPVFYP